MQQRHWIILFLLVFGLASNTQAANDFYASSVVVSDRQTDTFRKGLREALVQVLSKVSGVPADIVHLRPSLAQDLAQGDKLASQFVYYNQKFLDENGKEMTQLRIKASFPEARIMQLLQKGGLSFWSPDRPQLSVWFIKQDNSSAEWINQDSRYHNLLQRIEDNAVLFWGFAVTTKTPARVDAQRLWQQDAHYLHAILQQAAGKPILLARIEQQTNQQVKGTVSLLGTSTSQIMQAESFAQWSQQAIDWASLKLAQRYAVQLLSSDSEIVLSFTGVNQYSDYEALLNYVETIDIVKQVHVLSAAAGQLKLAVSFQTANDQLHKRLLDNPQINPSLLHESSLYQLHLHWSGE